MRWTLLLICSIGVSSLPGGCVSREEVATESRSSGTEDETESKQENVAIVSDERPTIVFRGKYCQTTGPCIDLGGGRLGMPFIDAFEVVEVLAGDLKAKHVVVRASLIRIRFLPSFSLSTWFSVRRYSIASRCSRLTQPARIMQNNCQGCRVKSTSEPATVEDACDPSLSRYASHRTTTSNAAAP
mgnify:CR=1 FL=1